MSESMVHIDGDPSLFQRIPPVLGAFCLCDENVREHCFPTLKAGLQGRTSLIPLRIPAGEQAKTLETCQGLWQQLLKDGAERSDLLIALGGGVTTDIGGFIADTYRRGMPFILIPTTLLGMVDAAIGGKNGVNLDSYKNMVGTFRTPDQVLIHPPFLRTLDERQLRSGYAEMLKHALLEGPQLFHQVKELDPSDLDALEEILPAVIRVKERIVEEDPMERKGKREVLNFGHTVGHALETLSFRQGEPLLHGEAVAAGMLIESVLSVALVGFPMEKLKMVENLVLERFGTISLPPDEALIRVMDKDKKKRDGTLRGVLLEGIGEPVRSIPFEEKDLKQAFRYYRELG